MENHAVVDAFEGLIKVVFDPTDPTGPQKDAGIHRQGIIVSTAEGEMSVGLMKSHFHMEKSMKGQKFRFESTSGEKGQLGGLEVGKWEKNGEPQFGMNVWGNATMYAVDQPANHDQSAKKEQQTDQPKGTGDGSADTLDWARNYFDFYRAIFDVLAHRMKGTGITADALTPIIATKFIPLERSGELDKKVLAWLKAKRKGSTNMPIEKESLVKAAEKEFDAAIVEVVDEQPAAEASPDNNQKEVDTKPVAESPQEPVDNQPEAEAPKEEAPVEKNWKLVTYKKAVISEMSKDDLIDVCIKVLPHHSTDTVKIKMVLKAAMKSKVAMELTYEEIYDVYSLLLNNDHDKVAVDTAYDSLKKKGKADDELCKEILFEQESFVSIVESIEKKE